MEHDSLEETTADSVQASKAHLPSLTSWGCQTSAHAPTPPDEISGGTAMSRTEGDPREARQEDRWYRRGQSTDAPPTTRTGQHLAAWAKSQAGPPDLDPYTRHDRAKAPRHPRWQTVPSKPWSNPRSSLHGKRVLNPTAMDFVRADPVTMRLKPCSRPLAIKPPRSSMPTWQKASTGSTISPYGRRSTPAQASADNGRRGSKQGCSMTASYVPRKKVPCKGEISHRC
jgi:hypothetical protein